MKKTILLVLVLALGIVPMSLTAEATWTQKADMPTVRFDFSTSVVNGKIYAIGGRDQGVNGAVFPTVEEYDPAADTWTQKADMPTPRTSLSTSVVDGKIYAIGGISDASYGYRVPTGIVYKTVEEYDPATDTWTQKADMPTARHCLSSSEVDGKIYAIGGLGKPGVTDAYGNLAATVVEEYDPATDSWTTKASFAGGKGKHWLSTSVVDGKIYAIGGKVVANAWATVEEYEPATDTWTRKTNMPTARCGLSTSVVNSKIYAIGGWSGWSGAPPIRLFATVEEYDPATDTWTKKSDMPTARCHLSTSAVNWKIYAIGGSLGSWASFVATSTVEEYKIRFIPADFNSDGIVDIKDLLILIENWGQNEPLVDIAPLPFGDGIVDALDMEILMSYWGQKVEDIIAHWALDETEGVVAHDSIGNNNSTLHGEPLWQPTGGKFSGALEFDGIDDYVSTDFVLDPAKGSLSVFAWIKGGAPGQVIISQRDTTDGRTTNPGSAWLWADSSYGRLITRLMHPPFDPLLSESVITDGQWHHIGLVYDFIGLYRYLYVDGAQVAKDTDVVGGVGSDGGLYIGAGKYLDAASFWSGLIDDVRIYNRAITP